MKPINIQPPSKGFQRWIRKTHTSLLRRINPLGFHTIPFDHGLRLRVRHIDRIGRRIYLDGYSEPELATFLYATLQPGMTFIDIGANLGQFTVLAARLVGPTGTVHAVEAASVMHQQIVDNLQLNAFDQATTHHLALSDREGTIQLNTCVPGQEAFNSIGRPDRQEARVTGSETVRTTTLDGFCHEQHIDHADILKIDVEGAEALVLQGGATLLGQPNAPVIFCEFNETAARGAGSSTATIRNLLNNYGYSLYRFDLHHISLTPEPDHDHYQDSANLIAAKHPNHVFPQLSK
ncbi:MAG: FkbM family methyltransferase [Phycisphaeraceae bacterium]